MDFEELATDLETTRKIISSDKYISELDELSPYKNEHELKSQVEYWSKLLLEKLSLMSGLDFSDNGFATKK